MKKQSGIRLTLKTAKALVRRELGISAAALTTECAGEGVYIYKMPLGRLNITVENDWYEQNGLYAVTVSAPMGESIRSYYHPESLEEDYGAGDRYRAAVRAEYCEGRAEGR